MGPNTSQRPVDPRIQRIKNETETLFFQTESHCHIPNDVTMAMESDPLPSTQPTVTMEMETQPVTQQTVTYTREQLQNIRNQQKEENMKHRDAIIDKHVSEFADFMLFTNQKNGETSFSKCYEYEDAETVAKIIQKLQTMFVDTVFKIQKSNRHYPILTATW